MDSYGTIIKKVRNSENLTLKEAALKLNVSVGWLSEVENNRGKAKLTKQKYEEIINLLNGKKYKPLFGRWVLAESKKEKCLPLLIGPTLKHYRKRANLKQSEAAHLLGFSTAYLSLVENGQELLSDKRLNQVLTLYNVSFKQYSQCIMPTNERSKRVPSKYRLDYLMSGMNESKIQKIYQYALSLSV